MSKRISITVSDEQYKALALVAEMNNLPVATAVYHLLREWMQVRLLSEQMLHHAKATILDASVGGKPN